MLWQLEYDQMMREGKKKREPIRKSNKTNNQI